MSTSQFESAGRDLQTYARNGETPPVRTITVAPDETRRIEIGDGERFTNTKIDVTAPGAAVEIVARGNGWEISHIAVVGQNQNPGGVAISTSVSDPDGYGIVRDVYLGDGNESMVAHRVEASHTGQQDILRLCVRGYARAFDYSPPGNPPSVTPTGAGGTVRVGACYAQDIDEWGFRLGSAGSLVQNCVAKDAGRCFWERWQKSDHTDCNARGIECWFAGNPDTPPQTATARVAECRGTGAKRTAGPGVIDGTVNENPNLAPPDSCPTTADEALLDDDELTRDGTDDGGTFSFTDPESI